VLGLLFGLVCLLVLASSAAAQSADAGTPSTPSPDQVTAEQAVRTAQPSPARGPVTTPGPSTGVMVVGAAVGVCWASAMRAAG
jgi:hypothetical protein